MPTDENLNGERYYSTRIDLSPEIQVEMIDILNQTLANTIDLWMQTKCSHWNVKGMQFYQLHQLFESTSAQLNSFANLVGDRVSTLSGVALGSVQLSARHSQIPEYAISLSTGKEHLIALAERLSIYAKLARECIETADNFGDADTADIYTQISRGADQSLWFLEAHLQV